MPIRLNLLAEAQAAAELRRRDPVKQALWLAGSLVCLVLIWSGGLQLKAMFAQNDVSRVEAQMMTRTNQYQKVLSDRDAAYDIQQKITALHQLTTNRFLNGNLLQALQQTTVDDVQLMRVRVDQTYAYIEGTKPRTNEDRITLGTPARTTEKILVTLEGSDASSKFDQYTKFQEGLAAHPYFKAVLVKTNGVTLRSGSLSSPQNSTAGKAAVSFILECRYPDKTR